MKKLFDSKEAKILWGKADDAVRTGRMLTELYNNVPKELSDVSIDILELHQIRGDAKLRKKVLKWLNED